MKSFIVKIFIFASLFSPAVSYGFFGMFGRDQCGYQQTPFPTNSNDYVNADQQRLKGLREYRATLSGKMDKLNSDLSKAQDVLKAYFGPPWCDAMFAHMDNEFDCCHVRATAQLSRNSSRMPAGQENPDSYVDEEVAPAPQDTDYTDPEDNSVPYTENPEGKHCLQTGFASQGDWNKYACRDGGEIDPQICSNASISKAPGNFQKCVDMMKIYKDLAAQKRALSSQIADVDSQINSRGTTAQNRSSMSGIGNFMSGLMSVALPFILSEYMSYTAKKQQSYAPLGPRQVFVAPGNGRNMYGTNQRRGTLGAYQQPSPPPPYYGPNYGYGLNYGGNYGQTLPGLQTGSFGCSPGMLGGGMNMLAALLGGGLNMNAGLNVRLGGSLGMFGGAAPVSAMQMGLGNNYPNVPPYTLGGYTPPYQPGGIYGGTPTYIPNFNTSVQNYYTGQQNNNNIGLLTPPSSTTCGTCSPNYNNNSYFGNSNLNAYSYAQQQNYNQWMQQASMNQSQLDYQLYQLRLLNSQNSNSLGTNYQYGNTNGLNSSLYSF